MKNAPLTDEYLDSLVAWANLDQDRNGATSPAAARTLRLVAEVRRLRNRVSELEGDLASAEMQSCDRCADEGGDCGGH